MEDIRENIVASINDAIETRNHVCTWMSYLPARDPKNIWAVVTAWMDWDNDGNWQLYAKVAYQPLTYLLKDYDTDWLMPYDEDTGLVWDTEIAIDTKDPKEDVDWLLEQWDMIKKERMVA